MALHISKGVLTADHSMEHELVLLAEKIPGLYIFVLHRKRAASAAVRFYVELPMEYRKTCPMSKLRYEIEFPNGSKIRFGALTDSVRSQSLPLGGLHACVLYSVKSLPVINHLMEVMELPSNAKPADLRFFPLFKDGDFVFWGDKFYAEKERSAVRESKENAENHVPMVRPVPTLDRYPEAQAIVDEEKVMARQMEEELKEQERERQLALNVLTQGDKVREVRNAKIQRLAVKYRVSFSEAERMYNAETYGSER